MMKAIARIRGSREDRSEVMMESEPKRREV
jgi:hypothetical protein